jgi:WD40 repeat protein
MAYIFRGQGGAITRPLALLATLTFAVLASPAALAQLSEQPMLVVDPGMHTAPIKALDVDAAGRVAVTGSEDKTVRVWSVTDGKLLRTIRMPAGPGDIGKIYAVAMSPDGDLIAAGGWMGWTPDPQEAIYVFETRTGKMTARIEGLRQVTHSLAFSLDGRYLAAGLGGRQGLRVYDRDRHWTETFGDTDYGDDMYGVTFAADGRLATASLDRKVRLYDRDFKLIVPPRKATGGDHPFRIAFSPDGSVLAIGYADAARGERRALPAGTNTVSGLVALPDGRLLVAAQDPFLALLELDGRPRWTHASPKADLREQYNTLAVSADGTVVDFGFEPWGKSPLRFNVWTLKLSRDPLTVTRRSQQGKPDLLWKDGVIRSPRRSMASQSS